MRSTSDPGSPDGEVTGQVLAGRYRLERPIASGGMARVWEASDQLLKRRVAVKILHPQLAVDETFVQRFRAEAISAARLTHPSIVSTYDTVVEGSTNAIVMELVVGTTLRADLDEHGPMKLMAVLAVGTQVADALQAAHSAGLVHRDVKPANILLSADGRVLVTDFGIAKAASDTDLTQAGSLIGTAKYLAPEQVEGGRVDGRADLYALGVVLYEALTGEPPFLADTDAGTAFARLHRDAVPPRQIRPDIPVGVEAVVMRAMARDPADRFADATAMRRALLASGGDPRQASAVASAAAAASTGERPAVRGTIPPPPPPGAAPPRPVVPADRPDGPRQVDRSPDRLDDLEHPSRRSRWPRVVLVVVALAAVAAAGAFFTDRLDSSTEAVAIEVTDYDPQGDNQHENPDDVGRVTDGDPDTTWSTERYDNIDLGAKDGVGLTMTTGDPVALASLRVTSPDAGWAAEIYVVDGEPPADLSGWGDPVARVTDASSGTTEVELNGARGNAVLLWFTQLSPIPDDDRHAVSVSAVDLHRR